MHLLFLRATTHSIQSSNRKERARHILNKRRKEIPNPSMIPPAPKVERERNEIQNVVTATMDIIPNHHA
jgi:hypothetical protein